MSADQTGGGTNPDNAPAPPRDYEDLIQLVHARYDEMSKSYRRIAVFLTQNPNEVAVQSVNAIAARCEIHASSLVRFAQSLGYSGFKELQTLFQRRLTTAAPGFESRVRTLSEELKSTENLSELTFLRDLVVRDIASLQSLLDDISQDDLSQAADLLDKAPVIFIIGQLRSEPVAQLLHYLLVMIGKRCVLLSPSGGLATHVARNMGPEDVLIAVSFRFYANEVVSIVDDVASRGNPVIAISDGLLSPLAKSASVLFAVPERGHSFSRSLAAPMCLAQALIVAVAARVQKNLDSPHIPTVTGVRTGSASKRARHDKRG